MGVSYTDCVDVVVPSLQANSLAQPDLLQSPLPVRRPYLPAEQGIVCGGDTAMACEQSVV